MPPKMRKKWLDCELEVLSVSGGKEANLSPGHELDGIFGGAGGGRAGRVGLGIQIKGDLSCRCMFLSLFS